MEHADQTPVPPPSSLRHDGDAALPAAAYLRYESRADGWSAGRQAAFLAHLADQGVVADAARSVGMNVSGGYALRREARGYAFNLGWEAALLIARRIVSDRLMAAAIKGEESRWVREEGVTTYIRQNTKLSLALLDRVNPATSLAEVLAVATRFDWFLKLVGDGVAAESLWELFFEDALALDELEARARVRAALLLCDDSAGFDGDGEGASDQADRDDDGSVAPPTEYKSMDGPRGRENDIGLSLLHPHQLARKRRGQRVLFPMFDLAQGNLLPVRALPLHAHHKRNFIAMSHTPHDLHSEFPDATEALHMLKTDNVHFGKLAAQYHDLNREIHRIDSGIDAASDDRTEQLKKERLAILDQVAVMITEVTQ